MTLLALLGPLVHARLHGPVMGGEWAMLHDEVLEELCEAAARGG